jgi:hypothetical protein
LTQPFWNINLKLTGLTENVWWVREPSYERGRVLRHPYSPDPRIGLLFRKCLFRNAISIFYSNFSQIGAGSRYWGLKTAKQHTLQVIQNMMPKCDKTDNRALERTRAHPVFN